MIKVLPQPCPLYQSLKKKWKRVPPFSLLNGLNPSSRILCSCGFKLLQYCLFRIGSNLRVRGISFSFDRFSSQFKKQYFKLKCLFVGITIRAPLQVVVNKSAMYRLISRIQCLFHYLFSTEWKKNTLHGMTLISVRTRGLGVVQPPPFFGTVI